MSKRDGRKSHYRIEPRFWVILFSSIYIVLGVIMLINHSNISQADGRVAELRAQVTVQQKNNDALANEIEFACTDQYIERCARILGMVMPGDIRFVASSQP